MQKKKTRELASLPIEKQDLIVPPPIQLSSSSLRSFKCPYYSARSKATSHNLSSLLPPFLYRNTSKHLFRNETKRKKEGEKFKNWREKKRRSMNYNVLSRYLCIVRKTQKRERERCMHACKTPAGVKQPDGFLITQREVLLKVSSWLCLRRIYKAGWFETVEWEKKSAEES